MTTDEALKEIQDYVRWMQEGCESDLGSVLNQIKYIRRQCQNEEKAKVLPKTKDDCPI